MTVPAPRQGSDVVALCSPEAYERRLVPALFEGWGEALVRLAHPHRGDRVLDVACGTGIVARLAAPVVGVTGSVVGLDADPEMLAVAREASRMVKPTIEWRQGDAHELPFPDESFDVVYCQQGLQFFADGATALAEMRRVLVPQGRIAVSVWRGVQHGIWATTLARTVERYGGAEAIEAFRAPCPFGEAEELRNLVIDVGFRDVQTTVSIEHLRSGSAEELVQQAEILTTLAWPLSKLSPQDRRTLIAALDEVLSPLGRDDGFAVPIEATVALARR